MHPERWLTEDDAVDGRAAAARVVRSEVDGTRPSSTRWCAATGRPCWCRVSRTARWSTTAGRCARSCAATAGGSPRRVDRRLEVPVLQLHGALDPVMLESTARASRDWLGPGSEYRCLPEIGHFPHQEAPHTTSRILIEFLARM